MKVIPVHTLIYTHACMFTKYPILKLLSPLLLFTVAYIPYTLGSKYIDNYRSYFVDDRLMILTTIVLTAWTIHFTALATYYCIYKLNHPFFEQFKDTPKPWPWIYDKDFKSKVMRGIKIVLFNNIVLVPTVTAFMLYTTNLMRLKTTASDMPTPFIYCIQLIFMLLCEDLSFYICHRLLHHPSIYRHIHKIHHEFYDTIVLASEMAHPVEFIVGNLIPVTLGAALLQGNCHLVTLFTFIVIRMIENVESHGGYDFPWAITRIFPFSMSSTYHNYHHMYNIGNYCSMLILWDTILGTNRHYFAWLKSTN